MDGVGCQHACVYVCVCVCVMHCVVWSPVVVRAGVNFCMVYG